MFPIINLGPLAIPVPQFSILISLWFGISLSEKFAPKIGVKSDDIYNLVIISVISGMIGARLGYIFENFAAFIQTPTGVFSLNSGMMDPFMGYSIGLLGMILFLNKKKIPIWSGLDSLVPLLAVIFVGVSISHIASGEAYGSVTSLPWGIQLWGAIRHPAQFYELFLSLIILFLAPVINKSRNHPGSLFLFFIALTTAARLFIEGFRGDSQIILGGIRSQQIIYWVILLIVFIVLDHRKRYSKKDSGNG
ncbi:MAG: prolipoprotein diacylglyceryl transferase family protein [Chloroflexota bacterium]